VFLTIIAASIFAFPGGTDHDFARALAREVGAPIIAVYDPSRTVKKVAIDFPDRARFLSRAKNVFDLRPLDGGFTWGFRLPKSVFLRQNRPAYMVQVRRVARPVKLAVKDDGVAIKEPSAKPTTVTYDEILSANPGVREHWYFKDVAFVYEGGSVTPRQLLKAALACVGGKLVQNREGSSVQINPPSLRKLLVATCRAEAKIPGGSILGPYDFEYLGELIGSLNDQQLLSLFESPEAEVQVSLAVGTPVYLAALKRVRARAGYYSKNPTSGELNIRTMLTEGYDLGRGMGATIGPDFVPSIIVYAKEGPGRLVF
jgi:hypothetical protein